MSDSTIPTTVPAILRALRLLGLGRKVIPHIVHEDLEVTDKWYDGTERLPVATAMYLVLFATAWLAQVYKSVAVRPGVLQQTERHLVAANELIQAQRRINQHAATGDDYIAANERWEAFEARGAPAWDEFFRKAMAASPISAEHVEVMILPTEVRH